MVEVQKLRTFYEFCKPRATLCGDSHGRGSKTEEFLRFLPAARDRGKKTEDLLRFLQAARDLRVVEVQKLRTFYEFCKRDPLRRSCVSKRSRCGAVRILLSLGEPSAEIVRVEVLSLWRRAILLLAKWPLEVVSWFARLLSQFDSPLVRCSSGLKMAF